MDLHDELFAEIGLRLQGIKKAAPRVTYSGATSVAAGAATISGGGAAPLFPYKAGGPQADKAAEYWTWFRKGLGVRLRTAAKATGRSVDEVLREPTAAGVCRICAEVLALSLSETEVSHLQHAPVSVEWLRDVLTEA